MKCFFMSVVLWAGLWFLSVETAVSAPNITLDVLEKPAHFFSGEKVARTITLKNQLSTVQDLMISWKTVSFPAVIQRGKTIVVLHPGEKKEIPLVLEMPEVRHRVELMWQIGLFSGESLLQEKKVPYTVFPKKLPFDFDRTISKSQVGLYDPGKYIEPYIKELGWGLIPVGGSLSNLENFSGKLLLLDGEALIKNFSYEANPQVFPFRDHFRNQLQGGMNIIVFDPIFLENAGVVPAEEKKQETFRLSKIFAPGHPVFYGLSEDDLCWWQEDGRVAKNGMAIKAWKGNLRILAADPDQQEQKIFLVEYPVGRGRWIFCSYSILEKFTGEPTAKIILANLVRYALTDSEPPRRTFIAADPESSVAKFFRELGVDAFNIVDDLNNSRRAFVVTADRKTIEYLLKNNPRFFSELKEFVRNGGLLLIFNLNPDTLGYFKDLLPADISLKSYDLEKRIEIGPDASLLWGISEKMLEDLFTEGEGRQIDGKNRIVSYALEFKENSDVRGFTRPCTIAKFQLGKGEIVISQIKFWESDKKEVTLLTATQFLTNLGIQVTEEN